MSVNQVIETYFCSTSITIPAGVTSIEVNTIYPSDGISTSVKFSGSGAASTLVKSVEGYLGAMGDGAAGQLGSGVASATNSTIVNISGLASKVYSAGTSSFYIDLKGSLYSSGSNSNGELGLGDVTARSSFVSVLGNLNFLDVVAAQNNTNAISCYGITDKSKIYSWGINSNGQLGHGNITPKSSPVAVLNNLTVLNFSAGINTAFAITPQGSAYSWGVNPHGQLGHGDIVSKSSPVAILGGISWAKILSDGYGTFALDRSGKAYSWGYNGYGQLGVGDIVSRSSPVAVAGILKFKDIFTTSSGLTGYVLALDKKGKAYSWGYNGNGNLGVGDVVHRSSPVAVLGNITFNKLYTDGYSSYGISTSGDLYSWGSNTNGQLGVGDVVSRSSPTLVLGGIKWSELFSVNGFGYTVGNIYGFSRDGKLYSWGLNANGQLGVGDIIPRSSPVAVLGGTTLITPNSTPASLIRTVGQLNKIKVIPGTTYTLRIGNSVSFFDSIPIGSGKLDRVEISYYL